MIHVDVNDPDWSEKVEAAYADILEALGIEETQGEPTVLLKGDPRAGE